MTQTRLALPVASATTLVTVDTARAALGLDAESVTALCESGRLLAFDVCTSCAAERRELRIWVDSIRGYIDGVRVGDDLRATLDLIIGHELAEYIPAAQLAQRFCVHRRSVYRWAESGDIEAHTVGHSIKVVRASLVPFLSGRRIR